jgi:hypothetical protein
VKNLIIQDIQEQVLTASQIASKHGTSRQYIHQIAKLVGISPYRKPPKPPYQKKARIIDGLHEKRKKYLAHKRSAANRGIGFKLTFEEWWAIWEPHYHKRGINKGCMCMCRELDQGAYEVGNVRIDLVQNNHHEKKVANHYKRGTSWMRQPTSTKGSGRDLPDFLNCQQTGIEEDPFVYYAELVTSHAYTKRD